MLSVRTNVGAVNAQRNMFNVNWSLSKSMEKLSSGFRINRAGDDAAGLAISEKLKAQVDGLNQAARNSLDGVSMIQTAEAGLDEIQAIMHRIRDLAVQGSNDTLGSTERDAINAELVELRTELVNISQRTSFNGKNLLDGTTANVNGSATGADLVAGDTVGGLTVSSVNISGASAATFTFTSGAAGRITLTNGTTGQAQTIQIGATLAGTSQTLDFSAMGVKVVLANSTAADITAATAVTGLTAAADDTIVVSSAGNVVFQTGAYAGQTTTTGFVNANINSASADGNLTGLATALTNFAGARTQANASALITASENALNYVSTQRSTLGAVQNRLEHTIANVKNAAENLAASNSRIRDVDVAEESASLAKYQILAQAGTAMLAQANQMPQLALKLLG